mmetsp:Transcript_11062/g.24366  ORF Transcript_11062/g.24366 Transcript_11062/m.24366 type:complete len:458 (+) Transcript_11062:224-1597(+)|eukprot:CAMPEP_0206459120 /NCGR_PEP_ID=MMETSP0324_2-20121206/23988_1 /ASSEMBLY_ACC=CAM_ASM_000836 /TAXON_ID=2866 /ORGANISM="Crypthecodinium cohnii, Strain Seligo" /LENGTH=457 /DNA_ID=CAMNT_0053930613 /DNA_START=149 /DNA_END=1522 /DNA_ORIENTATION=-
MTRRGSLAALSKLVRARRSALAPLLAGHRRPVFIGGRSLSSSSTRFEDGKDARLPNPLAAASLLAAFALSQVGQRTASCDSDDRSHDLYLEEQRTVALFERCSSSVVHIDTFISRGAITGLHLRLQETHAGTGSGFIWDQNHIVTNFHVIKDAERATVVLADGTSLEASIVGVSPENDLAVLKVIHDTSAKFPPLERGGSRHLKVGQRVFAIGNPFGLDQTLTNGIVSGLGREMRGVAGRTMYGLVQTDAAINPGNSGGPLLDSRGRLIGVNTMIASPSGAFAGVGFAIPVDTVERVVSQLIDHGHLRHAYLGVVPAPPHVMDELSRQLRLRHLPPLEGALILQVQANSPAADLQLQPTVRTNEGIVLGDEILFIGGQKITSPDKLVDILSQYEVGVEVQVVYRRRHPGSSSISTMAGRAKLGERPQQQFMQAHRTLRPNSPSSGEAYVSTDSPRSH